MMPAMSSGLIIDCRRESRSPWAFVDSRTVSIKSARRASPSRLGQHQGREELLGEGEDIDLIAFQRPRLGEAREVVDDDLAFGVDPRQGQRGE